MIKKILIAVGVALSSTAYSAGHPMDLSSYVERTVDHGGLNLIERRLTMHEVAIMKQAGVIHADGSLAVNTQDIAYKPLVIAPPKVKAAVQPSLPINTIPTAKGNLVPVAVVNTPKAPAVSGTSVPTATIANQVPTATGNNIPTAQTNTAKAPAISGAAVPAQPKGTVTARPTTMPANPTRDEIIHMQQDIQHIERSVGKALDLSLSAYAVAELPQATDGRSGVSVGLGAANGKVGEALGYSSNFGDQHEYTIKISVSHAGSENAAGAGFNYQW